MATTLMAPSTGLTILRRNAWMPEHVEDFMRHFNPKSDLGKLILKIAPTLPREQARALIESVSRTLVYESQLELTVFRANGRREDYGVVSRKVVTTAGVNNLANQFANAGTAINLFKFHGLGTTNTAEAIGDTALAAECTTTLNPDSTRATATNTNSTNTFVSPGTNAFDGTAAVVEHGLFSQAATGGGTLWDRSIFATVNVVTGDSILTTYTGTFTAGG